MATAHIHQIFYDQATRQAVEPTYIPLDNTDGPPDWYEFWPIKRYLDAHTLVETDWYGFLSPKFRIKSGFSSDEVLYALDAHPKADVLLLNVAFDQIAFFQNPFFQGETWHPGLLSLSQRLFNRIGLNVDLSSLINHSHNFTFCNYIVAKPRYWRAWHQLANAIWSAFQANDDLARDLSGMTSYNASGAAPIKTFIQERLPALLLQSDYQTAVLQLKEPPITARNLFVDSLDNRALLRAMDLLKRLHSQAPSQPHLAAYQHLMRQVQLAPTLTLSNQNFITHR